MLVILSDSQPMVHLWLVPLAVLKTMRPKCKSRSSSNELVRENKINMKVPLIIQLSSFCSSFSQPQWVTGQWGQGTQKKSPGPLQETQS